MEQNKKLSARKRVLKSRQLQTFLQKKGKKQTNSFNWAFWVDTVYDLRKLLMPQFMARRQLRLDFCTWKRPPGFDTQPGDIRIN